MSGSNCCFFTCIQMSQEPGKVVWYSHLFKNFPQFVVIYTVKGFTIVNEAEVDIFLAFPFFLHDPFPREENGNPVQYSCPGNPIDRRVHGVGHNLVTKQWKTTVLDKAPKFLIGDIQFHLWMVIKQFLHIIADWFQIGKGVCQGCILSLCLVNLYAEHIMRYTGWMKHKLESRLLGEI